ncbi:MULTISPECIES: hypothetical protein [unclassified Streptomyces]|uniref:restriction endonuclease subunit S n=1 Tax=unclassified Streptomyces TaxID=2593676 RepID=UPI000B2F07B8|nr:MULTISPECIES: hypothetical protein [unclassified Streptomyces]
MHDDVFLPGRLAELCVPLKQVTEPVSAGITLGPQRVPKRHASRYLRVANVRKGWIDTSDISTLEEQKQDRPRYELVPGDVLVVEGHADPGQIGRAAMATDEHSGLLYQNHLYRLRFTEAVPEFAVLWLNSPYVRSYWMTRCATSSGLYTINSKLLEGVPFPALSETEQRRIIAAHAVVGRRIAAVERVQAKLRSVRESVTSDLLAGPLGTVGDLLESKPKNGFSPVEVPDWTGLLALGLGCLTPEGFTPRQLKWVPMSDTAARYRLAGGDLLMSRANTRELVGLVGRYQDVGNPCIYPDLMMRLRPDSRRCMSEYLEIVLRSTPVRKAIQAGARGTSESMVKISADLVESLRVPILSLADQRKVVESISVMDGKIHGCRSVIDKLRSVQMGMMDDMLTGRVSVPQE